jgi:diacylglycerol kinase (ATP)
MNRIKMIYNPEADRGRSYEVAGDLRQLANELGGADWVGTVYPGHAIELAVQAAEAGYTTIVALGGDGTVHEVVNGLMQIEPARRPRLGVVPIGSGNDFAGSAGMKIDPFDAVRRIYQSTIERTLDIGSLRDASGRKEFWCNAVGIGFDAAINLQSRTIPWIHGFGMYFLATLKTIAMSFESPYFQLTIDGEKKDGHYLMLSIGNGTREGGGFRVTPDAVMDDGLLDYALVDGMSRLRILRLIPEVMQGTHGRFRDVHLGRLRRLTLLADRALPIHADGEMYAPFQANVREVDIEILPAALRMIG